MKNILGLGCSNRENYNNNDFYSYIQKNELTYIYILHQSDKLRLKCRESVTLNIKCNNNITDSKNTCKIV